MIFERGDFDNQKVNETRFFSILNESRTFISDSSISQKGTIFLSHKHEELDELRGTIGMLERHNGKVYIDSMDKEMPPKTSGETASRIKKIIKRCDKFILLATDLAVASKWCNWELGHGDAYKYIDRIAILPMKDKESEYKGSEYLQIYPSIQRRIAFDTLNNPCWYYYVKDVHGREICSLSGWINR